MPQKSARQLTVLVFRDNLNARTFRIPLRWITQFGWVLAAVFLTAALSVTLAIRASLKSSSSFHSNYLNPNRVVELEEQLKEARNQIQALSAKPVTPEATSAAPLIDPASVSGS